MVAGNVDGHKLEAFSGFTDGGSASDSTINSGYQVISSGGSVTSTTIYRGGEQSIHNAGLATGTIISGGSS